MEAVRVWEEQVIIPTYEVGEADKNPMFLEKRVYQGSSGKIYPYPSIQEISRTKTDKAWKAVFLENQYLKIMILPELGGRIQRAYDKTNQYDFVYYNHVIKPALVGLTGPWISGGIEFNWPQHHRPTTYSPVDYEIRQNADGSCSCVTSDVDQMYGTKEITTFTLYPDRAYIEIRGQLYNRTPLPQTFLWWANPAVSVNDDTQSIFPPDVHSVYDHGKRAVSRFPIATGEYYKHDYSEGVDISRYKNIPVPTSYMAERSEYNFVGGYDYKKKAGLLHVADHHISPGKKQWTWGNGDFGRAWDRNLTDADGPYIELMTGMFCDNQPDFSWLKPFEEKVFKQYFMPYKAVGQVKNASIHAAVNMEVREEGIYVCVYATKEYPDAEIIVQADGKTVAHDKAEISPVKIYETTFPVHVPDQYSVKVIVRAGGKDLVSYQPVDQGIPELASPAKAPNAPEEMLTNEELFLTAQHIEQYRHATWLPDPYYLEGLKRDKNDIRINNAYGLLLLRRGLFSESESYFRTAIRRLTGDGMFNNPYDGEPFYNLGLSLFYQERYEEAYDAFYKASWTNEQQEMSFYYLAVIACRRGDYDEALDLVEQGLVKNAHNVKARGLKAVLLERLGRREDAFALIEENTGIDFFDYVSRYERYFLGGCDKEELRSLLALSRNFRETILAAARDFAEMGEYEKAVAVLGTFRGDYPLIHYYKGFYLDKLGRKEEADAEYEAGEKSDPAYCFPNKQEDQVVLLAAAGRENSARACYYLGNLYYDRLQYDSAVTMWEKSAALNDAFPTLLRNLSIAYFNKCDRPGEALTCLERAFAQDPGDARVFLELDQLYQRLAVTPAQRLVKFRENLPLIEKRDDLYTEYVTVLNLNGLHKEAYDAIISHNFRTWEGAEGKISTQYKTALVEMAKEACLAGRDDEALGYLTKALQYPESLGEGRLEGTKDNHIYFHLGLVLERQGRMKEARECYENAALGAMEPAGMMYYYDQPADMIYYQGLAKQKLGLLGEAYPPSGVDAVPANKKRGVSREANARFYRLLDYGEQHIRDTFKMDYFAVSMPDMSVFDTDMNAKNVDHCLYLMGLGKLGLGRSEEAADCFDRVLARDPNHQNAAIYRKMAR